MLLEEIRVGMFASYSKKINYSSIKKFAELSEDTNPVHLNKHYAKNSWFKKRIAHGMMTASFFSALFGTRIPGAGCVYTYQSLNFKKPVYIDDIVKAEIKVVDVNVKKRKIKFKTQCKVNDIVVTEGEAEVYVPITFNKLLINKKTDLLKYKSQILKLFKDSFGYSLDENIWEWAYIKNPNGNPIVSLYFYNGKLIGHYAVIPLSFLHKQKNMSAVLSMTTMVDIAYRKYGVFVDQANIVYEEAKNLGYKFVCGFPNKKSAPAFSKRLHWTLERDLYLAELTYNELQKVKCITKKNNFASIDIKDKKNLEWRLNKPKQKYLVKDGNILKEYNNNFDIVFYGEDFSTLDKNKKYNLLLDNKLNKQMGNTKFDYIFGYKILDSSFKNIKIKKDLIISDIF
jgi:acyl dehydratase